MQLPRSDVISGTFMVRAQKAFASKSALDA
jgi:hypothetical protein